MRVRAPNEGGSARAYRMTQGRRRRRARLAVAAVVVVVFVVVAVFVLVHTAPPPSSAPSGTPGAGNGGGSSGGSSSRVSISLGAPVVGTAQCGSGGSVPSERVLWNASSRTISTTDVNVLVVELADGDLLPGVTFTPGVTPTDPCAGSAPSPDSHWYVVLSDPNGTNVAFYTLPMGWVGVGGGPSALTIANDSALTLLITPSVSGIGYGLAVQGFLNGTAFATKVTL